MSLTEKIEDAMNDMVATGKLPGVCCLNQKTLGELAQEFKCKERIVAPTSMPEPPVSEENMKIINGTPEHPYVVWFDVDENLADGEIVMKDVLTPEYERVDKKRIK
jgi:hypothetical protein